MKRNFLNAQGPLIHILAALILPTWYFATTGQAARPAPILACLVFALLPDIDSQASIIGRAFPIFSEPIERRFGHRQITHSALALVLVAGVTWLLFRSDWWLLTAAYGSHLIVDMLVGFVGVPIFWPAQIKLYIANIRPGSFGELGLGLLFATFILIPLYQPARQKAIALIPQEELVIPPTITPTPTATPATFTIKIGNVYDIDKEILISVGDTVALNQPIASLTTYRQIIATPTPNPTHTPTVTPSPTLPVTPSPPPTVSAFEMTRAALELKEAEGRYFAAAFAPTPNTNSLLHATKKQDETSLCYETAVAELNAWSISDTPPPAWAITAKEKERDDCYSRLIQWQEHINILQNPSARPGAQAAFWQFQQAQQRATATAAAWTPQPNSDLGLLNAELTATSTPSATPTPQSSPKSQSSVLTTLTMLDSRAESLSQPRFTGTSAIIEMFNN